VIALSSGTFALGAADPVPAMQGPVWMLNPRSIQVPACQPAASPSACPAMPLPRGVTDVLVDVASLPNGAAYEWRDATSAAPAQAAAGAPAHAALSLWSGSCGDRVTVRVQRGTIFVLDHGTAAGHEDDGAGTTTADQEHGGGDPKLLARVPEGGKVVCEVVAGTCGSRWRRSGDPWTCHRAVVGRSGVDCNGWRGSTGSRSCGSGKQNDTDNGSKADIVPSFGYSGAGTSGVAAQLDVPEGQHVAGGTAPIHESIIPDVADNSLLTIVINLDSRPERLAATVAELKRITAVPLDIVRLPATLNGDRAHLGCARSHARALRLALASGRRWALIAEDDVEIVYPRLLNRLLGKVAAMPEDQVDFGAVMLGPIGITIYHVRALGTLTTDIDGIVTMELAFGASLTLVHRSEMRLLLHNIEQFITKMEASTLVLEVPRTNQTAKSVKFGIDFLLSPDIMVGELGVISNQDIHRNLLMSDGRGAWLAHLPSPVRQREDYSDNFGQQLRHQTPRYFTTGFQRGIRSNIFYEFGAELIRSDLVRINNDAPLLQPPVYRFAAGTPKHVTIQLNLDCSRDSTFARKRTAAFFMEAYGWFDTASLVKLTFNSSDHNVPVRLGLTAWLSGFFSGSETRDGKLDATITLSPSHDIHGFKIACASPGTPDATWLVTDSDLVPTVFRHIEMAKSAIIFADSKQTN
jgi:hypothetical protein